MTGSVLFKKEVNSDGILNLFTANHSSRQSFMLADGKTMFGQNKLAKWGLSQDELFLNQGDVFGRVSAPELGFEKRDCAARQVGLVDVDSDGLLDLHAPPNGVYRQHPDHQFTLEWELAAATTSLSEVRAQHGSTRTTMASEMSLSHYKIQRSSGVSVFTEAWAMPITGWR